ncbi:MAG: pyridoxamine 5'-phosphate oxidase family protein [Candidatus Aenigmarchaeota archaeon]|nr:pyridoxamine 5'-phosphate oxidase family protein [Candidatus Aenigmarchaeota archaeon]
MGWKYEFDEGKELVLATSSKIGQPNANIVVSLGFVDGGLLIADCQMDTTIKNLQENPEVCLISGYLRVKGKAEIFPAGKYFDMCSEKSKDYKVKNAILVSIWDVFDLDKVKKVL